MVETGAVADGSVTVGWEGVEVDPPGEVAVGVTTMTVGMGVGTEGGGMGTMGVAVGGEEREETVTGAERRSSESQLLVGVPCSFLSY